MVVSQVMGLGGYVMIRKRPREVFELGKGEIVQHYLIRSGSSAGEVFSGLSSLRTAVEIDADLT